MLTLYRRHLKQCDHRTRGRKYRRCRCPIWADGFLGRQEIRKSLDTRDWEKAQGIIRGWEAEGTQVTDLEPVTIAQAWEEFLADAKARNLREPTLYKYGLLSRQVMRFAQDQGVRFLRELDLPALRKFRATWQNGNQGALKKLGYLRTFFRFAHDSRWIDENPARKLESPKVRQTPTLPFTPDEMSRILAASENYGMKCRGGQYRPPENARRIRALVLLLRHAGLRIADGVTLERNRIANGKLFLYTAKTGTPVYVPLPDFVLNALEAVPNISQRYFFWSGESKISSATSDWRRALKGVFKAAEVAHGHAHRFRHYSGLRTIPGEVRCGLLISRMMWISSGIVQSVVFLTCCLGKENTDESIFQESRDPAAHT